MEIYAFGSICRGEVVSGSDIDMLAIVEDHDDRFDICDYSVYSYDRIKELWEEGNPFSWHLYLESKPIFSSSGIDFLKTLGEPKKYSNGIDDCQKFYAIFNEAKESLLNNNQSKTLDLSTVFLCIRNFATCYSLHKCSPDFSRHSAKRLRDKCIPISNEAYNIYERARILCTRGLGNPLDLTEINQGIKNLKEVEDWMIKLIKEQHE